MSTGGSRANPDNQPRPKLNAPGARANSYSNPYRTEVQISRGWDPSNSGSSSAQGRKGYHGPSNQPQPNRPFDRWLNQTDVEGSYHGMQAIIVERIVQTKKSEKSSGTKQRNP